MISRNATPQEILQKLVRKPAGEFLWDHHDGWPRGFQGSDAVSAQRIQVPFKMAMRLLADAGKDCPMNKAVYLVEPLDTDADDYVAVGVYDNKGWIYSFTP